MKNKKLLVSKGEIKRALKLSLSSKGEIRSLNIWKIKNCLLVNLK